MHTKKMIGDNIIKKRGFTAFRFCDENKGGCGKRFQPNYKKQMICEECKTKHKIECLIKRRTLCKRCRKPLIESKRKQAYCDSCLETIAIKKILKENIEINTETISIYKNKIVRVVNSFKMGGKNGQ